MSLNFTQICELVLEEFQIIEEAYRPELDKLSKEALVAYSNKQRALNEEEAKKYVLELFSIREKFIEEAKKPTLHHPAKTEERVEEIMNKMAQNESSEHPRVHGTHFITWNYLKKFAGYLEK